MARYKVIILGKFPPPYFGPAIATEIILKFRLRDIFNLSHFDTRIKRYNRYYWEKRNWEIFLVIKKYFKYIHLIKKFRPDLILVPISQSTTGFIKDSIYIHFGVRSGSKILIHLRGSNLLNWLNNSSRLTRWYFRYILKETSGAIVLGENLKYLFNDSSPLRRFMLYQTEEISNFPS